MDPYSDPTRDLSDKREVLLDNGNKYHVEQQDPYGFWAVHMDKGQTPDALKGLFTTANKAYTAIQEYVQNNRVGAVHRKVVQVKEK